MPQPVGVSIPLSLPRRLVGDLLHFAQKVPTVPVQRTMRLGPVAAARAAADPRPSWVALFLKAYSKVCAANPPLRRAYLTFPRERLYEHPGNVASVALERDYGGEPGVFFAHINRPEARPLAEIDVQLRHFKEGPIEEIGAFRRQLRTSRLPRFARRWLWWVGLNLWGRKRAHMMGTFGMSVYGSLGAASLHPLSVMTTTLNYGPIAADGTVDVRLVYDHRVLDGGTVARALAELEDTLNGDLADELAERRHSSAFGNAGAPS